MGPRLSSPQGSGKESGVFGGGFRGKVVLLTLVGSNGGNTLRPYFSPLWGPGCTQETDCTNQTKQITNNVQLLSSNRQFLSAAIFATTLGRSFHVKQGLSILPLSAATVAFVTPHLLGLFLVLPAANLVCDLFSARVCSSRSVSWLWFWLSTVIFLTIHCCCLASAHHLKYLLPPAQHFSGNLQTQCDLVEHALPTKMPHQLATSVRWWHYL